MPQRSPKETFLQAFATLGGSAGSGKLRTTLGWNEPAYGEIKQALVDDGGFVRGRGRGGPVAVTQKAVADAPAPKPSPTKRRERAPRSTSTAAHVGYEAELWQMADTLRGKMDAAVWNHGAAPQDRNEYRAENIFWAPPEARWPHLKNQVRQSTIDQVVDTAMEGLYATLDAERVR